MRHVQHLVQRARAAGISIDPLLALAGLDDQRLTDPDATVPVQTLERLLNALAQQHRDVPAGLYLANQIQPASLGALGFILQACSTFAELLDVVERYNGMLSNIGHSSVRHLPGLVELCWECRAGSPLLRRHAQDYVIGTFVAVARLLAPGVGPLPQAVYLAHPRPTDPQQVREYFDFFRCPVHFDRPVSAVSFPASLLSVRLPSGDAVLKDLLEQHGRNVLQQRIRPPSWVEDVKRLLASLLLEGIPGKEAVAQQLGISTRSLHRRLQENGTHYRALLDAVRLEQARQQLRSTQLSSSDIAQRLGFHSRQAFMRWFRQHTGVTPGDFRRQDTGQPNAGLHLAGNHHPDNHLSGEPSNVTP